MKKKKYSQSMKSEVTVTLDAWQEITLTRLLDAELEKLRKNSKAPENKRHVAEYVAAMAEIKELQEKLLKAAEL